MNNNSSTRGLAYFRMSSDPQEASIPAQRKWAREAASREGVQLIGEFEDPGIPGSEVEHRPGLQSMIAFAEREWRASQPIDAVIVWHGNRLSRATSIKTAAMLNELQDAGVSRLLTIDGWTDLDDATHRVMYLLKQDLANSQFSEDLAKNVLRGLKDRAREGLWCGGPVPFGYALDAGRLVPHPIFAAVVRWMFAAYARGEMTIGGLRRELAQRGIASPHGRRFWSATTLTRLLSSAVYLGKFTWNLRHRGSHARLENGQAVKDDSAKSRDMDRRRRGNRKHALIYNDAEHALSIEHNHEPLIDAETFKMVQRRLVTNRKYTNPAPNTGGWLLTGLIRCGCCGGPMHGYTAKVKRGRFVYKYYQCKNARGRPRSCTASKSIPADRLLDEVLAEIQAHFADGPALDELQRQMSDLLSEGAGHIEGEKTRLREQVKTLEAQIQQGTANLALLPSDLIADVVAKVRSWKEEKETAARTLATLERAAVDRSALRERIAAALAQLQTLHKTIKVAPASLARAGLADVVSRVTVHYKPNRGTTARHMEIDAIEVEINPVLLSCCEHLAVSNNAHKPLTLVFRRDWRAA